MIPLLVLLAIIVGSPYWLPAAGKRVARTYGVSWESAESGFVSLDLRNVAYSGKGLELRIDSLHLPQPLHYAGSRLGWTDPEPVRAGNIQVVVKPDDGDQKSGGSGPAVLKEVHKQLQTLSGWLPELSVGSLTVGPPGKDWVSLQDLHWEEVRIEARWSGAASIPPAALELRLEEEGYQLDVKGLNKGEGTRLELALSSMEDGYSAKGRIFSGNVPLRLSAELGPERWIPGHLAVSGSDWPVPGWLLQSEDARSLNPVLTLDLQAEGMDYKADVKLIGDPSSVVDGQDKLVCLVTLSGDSEHLSVRNFSLQSDWLTADLSAPVEYSYRRKAFTSDATFTLSADLSGQPWVDAGGTIEALATLDTESIREARASFSLEGRDLAYGEHAVPHLVVEGSFLYPELVLDTLTAELGDDSQLNGEASWDWESRNLEADATFRLTPEWVEQYREAVPIASPLEGELTLQGPPEALEHSGNVFPVTLILPALKPVSVDFTWEGRGIEQIHSSLNMESQPGATASLEVLYKAGPSAAGRLVKMESLYLDNGGGHAWELTRPFTVFLDPDEPFGIKQVTAFNLVGSGEGKRLEGIFDPAGKKMAVTIAGLEVSQFMAWVEQDLPLLRVNLLELEAATLDPLIANTFLVDLRSTDEKLEALSLRLEGSIQENGIDMRHVAGTFGKTSFIDGQILLPFRFYPLASDNRAVLEILDMGRMTGDLTVSIPEEMLSGNTGLPMLKELEGVRFNLDLGGTVSAPEAKVEASLAESSILGQLDPRFKGIPLRNVELLAFLSSENLEVKALQAVIDGARVSIEGRVPAKSLFEWARGEREDWKDLVEQAEFNVSLQDFKVATFASFLPSFIRSSGRIEGNLVKKPGMDYEGALHFRGLSLRPTLYSQTISGITVSLDLTGSRFDLTEANARIGDSLVTLSGFFDLEILTDPVFRIEIEGDRTPLVRTPDLLLHSNLRLTLDGLDRSKPPVITGDLELRDSVILMDIDPLAARTAGRSLPKPPFFSIDQDPFSEWLLDVNVSGNDALRLKSQYVESLLSAEFDLGGTLGSPVLVGSVSTNTGEIEFPGTTLELARSEIFVTRDQQDSMQLDIQATGRTASHVLSVRIRGTAADPQVELSSTPSLDNARIFNLLATGNLESTGLSNVGLYLGKGIFSPGAGSNGLLDRLSVDVGRDVTESGSSTVDVYYELTEDLRLHGEYDKYDAQNLDLEWEVFSK